MQFVVISMILATGGVLYFMARLLRKNHPDKHGIIVGMTAGVLAAIWMVFLLIILSISLHSTYDAANITPVSIGNMAY